MGSMKVMQSKVKEYLLVKGYTEEEAHAISKAPYPTIEIVLNLEKNKDILDIKNNQK